VKISKIICHTDGTALCFVNTVKSEDSLNTWAESNLYDRHWFTGWDLTDTGFEFTFDMSECFDSSCYDTLSDYYQVLESNIIEQTGLNFASKIKRINADFRLMKKLAEETA